MTEHEKTETTAPEASPQAEAPSPTPRVGDTRPAPRIGDTRPARPVQTGPLSSHAPARARPDAEPGRRQAGPGGRRGRAQGGHGRRLRRRRRRGGRDRKATRTVGRYLMCVHVEGPTTHIAMLEGRSLVEHYVVKETDETTQIDGNLYLGRVQNVLPGMEAAFVDIGIPKNAVLYRGDVRYDLEDVEGGRSAQAARIEEMLKAGQLIVCQVTKNPIGAKGARLTQEVSLPGRFAVLVPELVDHRDLQAPRGQRAQAAPQDPRRDPSRGPRPHRPDRGRGRQRRGAPAATSLSSSASGRRSPRQAERSSKPGLLYRELDLAVRMLREELNGDYRGRADRRPATSTPRCGPTSRR